MRRSVFLGSVFCTLILTGCGHTVEPPRQDITFLAPQAQDAKCSIHVGLLGYQVVPPQTISVARSEKDMKVMCSAPGNRVAEVFVASTFETRPLWGGPPSTGWDYSSESSFSYPDVIEINFPEMEEVETDVMVDVEVAEEAKAEPIMVKPDDNAVEVADDKIVADEVVVDATKDVTAPLKADDMVVETAVETISEKVSDGVVVDKQADLQDVLDAVTESDVSVEGDDSVPIQLYPGQ